jgi:lysophospholipase L1-like esterase
MKKLSGSIIIAVVLLLSGFRIFAQDPLRFSKEIEAYKNADKSSPPSKGCVLFYGSSSIRMWQSVAADFPGYCVINRGFGGSQMSDANYYFNDLVVPYKPQIIVLYEGDNDLADRKKPEQVLTDFKIFLGKVEKSEGNIPVLYIAAKPSPSRWGMRDLYAELNKLINDFCNTRENLEFIDVTKPMMGENGRPEPDLFRADSLHMTPKGYAIWTSLVDPYLKKYYDPEKVMKQE